MKNNNKTTFKITYLIILSIALFFIDSWIVVISLFLLNGILWFQSRLELQPLVSAIMKIKWFIIIIFISYTLMPPSKESVATNLDLTLFNVNVYFEGLKVAFLMVSRIILMIMTSLWVRLSSSQECFINSLKALKVPESIAIVIDLTLNQLMVNKKSKSKKKKIKFKELKKNKFQLVDQLIEKNIQSSEQLLISNYPDLLKSQRQNILVILSVVVAIMSLKFLQMMPGLPIAPGHKNLLVIPLLVLASIATPMKHGGLAAGFATGIVSFLMGFGKFGLFEILHFAVPGLVSDWLSPFIKESKGKFLFLKLVVLGAVLGFSRFIANISILFLAGAPKLALAFMLPMLISQMLFGTLSSLVCLVVIKKHQQGGWFT
jgi:hypothetical protein